MDGALPAAFPAFEPVHGGDIPIIAGFECGRLHWSGHDLLHSTGHLPDAGMAHHYATAIGQGAAGARDGLSWRHDVVARVQAVPDLDLALAGIPDDGTQVQSSAASADAVPERVVVEPVAESRPTPSGWLGSSIGGLLGRAAAGGDESRPDDRHSG